MKAIELTPIDGGFCVKRADDRRCIDLMRMLFSWRIVLTVRPDDPFEPHALIEHGWCYFGHGVDDLGHPRTMQAAFLRALAAIEIWDGTEMPPDYDKQAC